MFQRPNHIGHIEPGRHGRERRARRRDQRHRANSFSGGNPPLAALPDLRDGWYIGDLITGTCLEVPQAGMASSPSWTPVGSKPVHPFRCQIAPSPTSSHPTATQKTTTSKSEVVGQIGAVLIYNRNGSKVFESEIKLPTETPSAGAVVTTTANQPPKGFISGSCPTREGMERSACSDSLARRGLSCHLVRLGNPHQLQDGWRHVGKDAGRQRLRSV